MEGSHSGQLHEFRKLEGVIPTQVQILYPPQHFSIAKIYQNKLIKQFRENRWEKTEGFVPFGPRSSTG